MNKQLDPTEQARRRQDLLFEQPPRISALDRNEHAEAIVAATTKLKNAVSGKVGPPVPLEQCPVMVATLVRFPELWNRLSMLSAQVQCADASLPVRLRQLAIMRTVWLCGAPYQWGEHIARTKQAGITVEEIERIKLGSHAVGWNSLDKAILTAVEQFRLDTFVSDSTWAVLSETLDQSQLVELLVLIGQFTTVAFVLNSLRVGLETHNKGFFA